MKRRHRKWAIIIALAAAWLGYAPAAKAELSDEGRALIKKTYGCDVTDKCVVENSPGGRTVDFISAAALLYDNHKTLEIDGDCDSACLVGAARSLLAGRLELEINQKPVEGVVCVRPRARFGIHQPYHLKDKKKGFIPENIVFESQPLTAGFPNERLDDLRALITKKGVPRTVLKERMPHISFEEASVIWPKCGQGLQPMR